MVSQNEPHNPTELTEKPKKPVDDLEGLLVEASSFVESKEPTPEEKANEFNGLKEEEEGVHIALVEAKSRLNEPNLDAGFRNLALAIADAGIRTRGTLLATLETAAVDGGAPIEVKTAVENLLKLRTAREQTASKNVPPDQQPRQQELLRKIQERMDALQRGIQPALQQMQNEAKNDLKAWEGTAGKEAANIEQMQQEHRGRIQGEIQGLGKRLPDLEAKQLVLIGDRKTREVLLQRAGEQKKQQITELLQTPEGLDRLVQELVAESGYLPSPEDVQTEYQRRKPAEERSSQHDYLQDEQKFANAVALYIARDRNKYQQGPFGDRKETDKFGDLPLYRTQREASHILNYIEESAKDVERSGNGVAHK